MEISLQIQVKNAGISLNFINQNVIFQDGGRQQLQKSCAVQSTISQPGVACFS